MEERVSVELKLRESSFGKRVIEAQRIIGKRAFSWISAYLNSLIITTSRLIVPREQARLRPSRDQA